MLTACCLPKTNSPCPGHESKIVLFDELICALDPEMIKEVLDVMLDLTKEDMTMV